MLDIFIVGNLDDQQDPGYCDEVRYFLPYKWEIGTGDLKVSWKYTLNFLLYDTTFKGVPGYVKLPGEYLQNIHLLASLLVEARKENCFLGEK